MSLYWNILGILIFIVSFFFIDFLPLLIVFKEEFVVFEKFDSFLPLIAERVLNFSI